MALGTNAKNSKYCSETNQKRYEITLIDDATYKATFNLYDNTTGRLLKSTQGEWTIRDEGVYGSVYRLTFEFTGANSNLPSMKFTCQYDGYGQLQAIIDSQDRTWNQCR
jgi:YD repeat-containing protein